MSPTPACQPALCGAILAGGAARRMGGADKGLLLLNQRSLVSWTALALAPQVSDIMIVANRNLRDYAALGYPVIEDLRSGFLGPLAGFEAALSACQKDWLLSCPVDAPYLPAGYARRMQAASAGRPAVASLAGHMEPLHALIPRSALPSLQAYLAAGGRKTGAWLQSLDPVLVSFDDNPQGFRDADTPEALAALRQSNKQ